MMDIFFLNHSIGLLKCFCHHLGPVFKIHPTKSPNVAFAVADLVDLYTVSLHFQKFTLQCEAI